MVISLSAERVLRRGRRRQCGDDDCSAWGEGGSGGDSQKAAKRAWDQVHKDQAKGETDEKVIQ